MMGLILPRFYCEDCDKFIDRRKVTAAYDETIEPHYYCKECGSSVLKVGKILQHVVRENIAWDHNHCINTEKYR